MRHPKGPSRYIIALLAELARLKPLAYRLTLDGEVIETKAVLVALGNGVSLGGGMKITPDAQLDDGLLDVLMVKPLSRFNFLRIFPRVFAGTHVTDPRVRIERAKTVRIEADGIVAYGDGERIAPLPIDVEVVPGAVRVLAPHP
jgi:diacylglycerol kinase (ATP)